MLIAPIFHNNYLTQKRSDSQTRPSENTGNLAKADTATSSGTYNIIRSAFNRGTELLKSTFLVKQPIVISSDSEDISNPPPPIVTKQVVNDTPVTISDSESSHNSSPAVDEVQNDDAACSSPDSIKTELMLFKPISREPRTTSSSKIIRVPSIRSTSSNSNSNIHSPCPSPFFIPITPNRQSAFSFVAYVEIATKPQPSSSSAAPKTNKRRVSNILSPEKKSEGTSSSFNKRQKKETVAIVPAKRQTRKNASSGSFTTIKAEIKVEKTEGLRETRSRKRNSDQQMESNNKKAAAYESKETKVFKSPQKPAHKRKAAVVAAAAITLTTDERRRTRSMKT